MGVKSQDSGPDTSDHEVVGEPRQLREVGSGAGVEGTMLPRRQGHKGGQLLACTPQ